MVSAQRSEPSAPLYLITFQSLALEPANGAGTKRVNADPRHALIGLRPTFQSWLNAWNRNRLLAGKKWQRGRQREKPGADARVRAQDQ